MLWLLETGYKKIILQARRYGLYFILNHQPSLQLLGVKLLIWLYVLDGSTVRKISIDKQTSHQYFSKRKAQSTWSKVNKQKIELLTQQGLMADAGYKSIETAKQNGSWTILDEVEELIMPNDLNEALTSKPLAMAFYDSLSKSVKKGILLWLVLAKRPETRQKRIIEIAVLASQNKKPKHL